MRFRKGSLTVVSNNPMCDRLYLRQGWIPVKDVPTPAVAEKSVAADFSPLTAETDEIVKEPIRITEPEQTTGEPEVTIEPVSVTEENLDVEENIKAIEPDKATNEPVTKIEDDVKEEVKEPAVKAKTTKTTSVKSTTQKRTYQKRK